MTERKEKYYEKYIGKWISVTPLPGEAMAGLMQDYDDGYALINPFFETIYSNGHPEATIVEREVPARVRIDDALSIIPKTKKDLEGYCKFRNKEIKKEAKRQKKKGKKNSKDSK